MAGAVKTNTLRPLDVVSLRPLMARTTGTPEVRIGLIDGPVVRDHPDLVEAKIHQVSGSPRGIDDRADDSARMHGTFVAGMLSAGRSSAAPAICPDCTLLLRPVFGEAVTAEDGVPSATPE